MWTRFIFALLLVLSTAVFAAGLPVWTTLRWVPCGELAFLILAQRLKGAELVGWSGFLGLTLDLTRDHIGLELVCFVTAALLVALFRPMPSRSKSLLSVLISFFLILTSLGGVRLAAMFIAGRSVTDMDMSHVASPLLLAFAFSAVLCLLSAVVMNPLPDRTAHDELRI